MLVAIFKAFYDYFNELTRPIELPVCGSSAFKYYDYFFQTIKKIEQKN